MGVRSSARARSWGRLSRTGLQTAWQRGAVEVGVVGVAAALLLGTVVGSGAASTVVRVGDGLTWLADDERGQVVEVNPATGRPQTVLQVAPAGSDLAVAQQDGRLVLTDGRTGAVTSVDLATLVASGHRQAGAGGQTQVLMSAGRVILAELSTGRVRAADAGTLEDIGTPLVVGPLASAVVDKAGTVWLAGKDGVLRSARWSEDSRRFVVQGERPLEGTGDGTALVPHERGVTVFSPSSGVVAQVGTGAESSAVVPGMRGAVQPAQDSPRDVVPVTSAETSSVVILSSRGVVEVSTAGMRCSRPGRPSVFAGRVYVPCPGDGRVVVLAPDGSRAGPDVITDGDPRLTVDDGRLIVSTRDGARATVVEQDGSSRQITVRDESQPVRGVAAAPAYSPPPLPPRLEPPPPPPPPPSQPPTQAPPTPPVVTPSSPSGAAPDDDPDPDDEPTAVVPTPSGTGKPGVPPVPGVPGAPGGGSTPDGQPSEGAGAPPTAATGVSAVVSGTDTVTVSWTGSGTGGTAYAVQRSDGTGGATAAAAGATQVVLPRVAPGTGLRWVVVATVGGRSTSSAPSNAVDVAGTTQPPPTTPPPTTAPPTTPPPPPPPPPPVEPPPPPPAPPALPAEGAVVVVDHLGTRNGDGTVSVTANLVPPADWAGFAGTCALWVSTPDYGPTSSPIACNSTGWVGVTDYGSSGSYGVWMTASNDVGTATSATLSFEAYGGPPGGSCYNRVGSTPTATSGVEVVPASVPMLPPCQPNCPIGGPCYDIQSGPSGGDEPGRVVLAFGLLGLGLAARALRRGRLVVTRG